MKRMRTFLIYALIIVGFIFLSHVLEDGLISGMYKLISGSSSESEYNGMYVEDVVAKASNMNGYMSFNVLNRSSETIECFAKIDLFTKRGLTACTEYVPIEALTPGSSRNYTVKYEANEVASYKISLVEDEPDKSNIINVLGWEIDLTNVFGFDLTNVKIFGKKIGDIEIFGKKLSDIFTADGIKSTGSKAWNWIRVFLASIPWWGYAIGGGIVLWYMPKGFLFGIFPF